MAVRPCNDVFSLPDPAYGQHRLRLGEIGIFVEQLMNALNRDAENLRHLWHAHEILCHLGKLANS
jgi:hypothetical protein